MARMLFGVRLCCMLQFENMDDVSRSILDAGKWPAICGNWQTTIQSANC